MPDNYFLYIIECSDGSYFIDLTNKDLLAIYELHTDGIADCYTFSRRPLKLVYYETIPTSADAIKRERQLKGWSRAKKKALIEHNYHKLQLLSECQNMSHHKYREFNTSPVPNPADALDFAQETPHPGPSASLRTRRIGILGGGQLGRMLLQAAINYPVETFVLENDPGCPSAHLCHHFSEGDIRDFDDVYNFGKNLDAITIEIESVNVDALEKLENDGVKVFPTPAVIRTINNKILQKEFYRQRNIPSPEFVVTKTLQELYDHSAMIPAVHKLAMGGYDGRGVQVIRSEETIESGFDAPAVLEKMVNIKTELAIIVARNENMETAIYPAVEMVMDPVLNLLDYQLSPSYLEDHILLKAEAIALSVANELSSPGIFAIEMFVDNNNEVWVNETAPRVHNSGHHSIEANFCSQFDMLWRVMLNYPLGDTALMHPSCMVNIVGLANFEGNAVYEGLEDVLKISGAFIHLYGKVKTKPGRKMGHVTLISNERGELVNKANMVKMRLRVVSE